MAEETSFPSIAATDFFSVEVLTRTGLVRYFVLFVIDLKTRRVEIAGILLDIIDRAIQIHGALGYTTDMPLEHMYRQGRALRIADGADEVHKQAMARQIMKEVEPVEGYPTEHVPTRRAEAIKRFGAQVEAVRKGS